MLHLNIVDKLVNEGESRVCFDFGVSSIENKLSLFWPKALSHIWEGSLEMVWSGRKIYEEK